MKSFERLSDLIGAFARRRHQMAEKSLATIGLNHTEARLLTLLRQSGAATKDVLSNQVFVHRRNASRALKHHEQTVHVVTRRDQAGRRAQLGEPTRKGCQAVVAISRLRKSMARGFFGDLKPAKADTIADLLERALNPTGSAEDGPSSPNDRYQAHARESKRGQGWP